jgi:hypothetical protein
MEVEKVPIDLLEFDPDNPRLPSRLKGKNDPEVFKYMLNEAALTDLMLSIAEQGYFHGEPLLVVPSSKSDKYTVVEGNRRLAALLLLKNPEKAPVKKLAVENIKSEAKHSIDEVSVIKYQSREEVLDYLGYRHITGVANWDSLAKARYLKSLFDSYDSNTSLKDTLKILARTIGTNTSYVRKLLTGYRLYEYAQEKNFYGIEGLEERFDFSLLTTAISYTNISEYLGYSDDTILEDGTVNESRLSELIDWVYKQNSEGRTRLGDSRNLKYLNAVVASPVALDRFKSAEVTLDDAYLLTDGPDEAFRKLIQLSLSKIKEAFKLLPTVRKPTISDIELLSEIRDTVRSSLTLVNEKISQNEDE